jgi:hypothetical protein
MESSIEKLRMNMDERAVFPVEEKLDIRLGTGFVHNTFMFSRPHSRLLHRLRRFESA